MQVGVDVTGTEKVWRMFQAIGDIAFAYAYSNVLIEIQASYHVIKYYVLINVLFSLFIIRKIVLVFYRQKT